MPESNQNQCLIAMTVPTLTTCGFHQRLYFAFSQIFARPHIAIFGLARQFSGKLLVMILFDEVYTLALLCIPGHIHHATHKNGDTEFED